MARFLVHLPPGAPAPDGLDAVAREVQLLCRTWEQELVLALGPRLGDRARRVGAAWADRLPASYRDAVPPSVAADDVVALDELSAFDGPGLEAWFGAAGDDEEEGVLALTVASAGAERRAVPPAAAPREPGLWVVDELSWDLGDLGLHRLGRPAASASAVLDGPGGAARGRGAGRALAGADRRRPAEPAGHGGRDDVARRGRPPGLPPLPAPGRPPLRVRATWTRCSCSTPTSPAPSSSCSGPASVAARVTPPRWLAELEAACDKVERLDHDRILRGLVGTVEATIRTNARRAARRVRSASCSTPRRCPTCPSPVPYREIFVHGPTVEGVHLRAGPVARGGLRYSDRPEDLRAEVLDLMRTQVLKNALIVPTGAKGGFVLRGPGAAVPRKRCGVAYETFVGCLLDLDRSGRRPVPRRRGGQGHRRRSATSPTGIAVDRSYWLGDAFASGGSVGYDHRALGITARGAWVAIDRHFRELDVDVATDSFTAVGIGDMSGDVFGNGMLLAPGLRLLAAFDHRDVFLDPDPDPEAALAERARLHDLAGSSWQDYDRTLLSEGGGVLPRSLKRIELHPRVQAALGIQAEALTPPELIQAILRAPVDLLYLGGIGTYVRGSAEPDAGVDDRANAEVRVTRRPAPGAGRRRGGQPRVHPAGPHRVRPSGRTHQHGRDRQLGRGRHLGPRGQHQGAAAARRSRPVRSPTRDRAAAARRRPPTRWWRPSWPTPPTSATRCAGPATRRRVTSTVFEAAQRELVDAGIVDPDIEALPGRRRVRRPPAGRGRAHPARAGRAARRGQAVGEGRGPRVGPARRPVHPRAARRRTSRRRSPTRFGDVLDQHRLRRELIASELTNEMVDHLGPAFASRLASETGRPLADVARAYWVARSVAGGPALWRETAATVAAGRARRGGRPGRSGRGGGRAARVAHPPRAAGGHGPTWASASRGVGPVFRRLAEALPKLDRPEAARARRGLAERLHASGTSPDVGPPAGGAARARDRARHRRAGPGVRVPPRSWPPARSSR